MNKARRHIARVVALGCLPCRDLGHEDTPAMAHHIRNGQGMSQRATDFETIPLCHYHHQGPEGIHTLGTRVWEAKYGRERDMLARVRQLLGVIE